jgi:arylsulfatase
MGLGAAALSLPGALTQCGKTTRKPNIIFILADDLGYGELGSYGQQKIRTPHIDRLAKEGMSFTQHYSGSAVCAPSRCCLLTGKHTGHSYIRINDEMAERGDVWKDPSIEGQRPILPGTVTIGTLLQQAGYRTGAVGKWGLGGPAGTGAPNKQGFHHWYGYLCQRQAHNYYPTHLWRNDKKHILEGNNYFSPHQKFPEEKDANLKDSYREYSGTHYAADLMTEEALQFIRQNKANPFFLYLPYPIPHVALQVPEDSLKEYEGRFPETPYKGQKAYLPHMTPRAAYAAMITRMDRDVGRIMALLKELGLDEDTLVIFTSDNGPTYAGGVDYTFFDSAGPLRGLKGSLYEGGVRVPMIARWPGKIKAGSKNHHISAFWDFLPTFTELAGCAAPGDIDGLSLLPTLTGKQAAQKQHEYLYWEHARKHQAVRMGRWKGIRHLPDMTIELYDLENDLGETRDVASQHPEIVQKIAGIMKTGRTPSQRHYLITEKKEPAKKKKPSSNPFNNVKKQRP